MELSEQELQEFKNWKAEKEQVEKEELERQKHNNILKSITHGNGTVYGIFLTSYLLKLVDRIEVLEEEIKKFERLAQPSMVFDMSKDSFKYLGRDEKGSWS